MRRDHPTLEIDVLSTLYRQVVEGVGAEFMLPVAEKSLGDELLQCGHGGHNGSVLQACSKVSCEKVEIMMSRTQDLLEPGMT